MPPAAAWCSLCFGRLSAQAEPAPPAAFTSAPVSETAAQVPEPRAALASYEETTLSYEETAHSYEETTHLSPVSLAERPTGWPCRGCHALVSLDLMACPTCGAPFLPSDTEVSLPVVGDPRSLSNGMKIAIMAGGSTAVALVVFLLFVVLGSLL